MEKRPFVTLTCPESQTLHVGRRREQVALTANKKRQSENSVWPTAAVAGSRLLTEYTRAFHLVIPGEEII